MISFKSLDLSQASEKKKIPSLLDLEIYPPGQEPKIPSPTFSPRPYKRFAFEINSTVKELNTYNPKSGCH